MASRIESGIPSGGIQQTNGTENFNEIREKNLNVSVGIHLENVDVRIEQLEDRWNVSNARAQQLENHIKDLKSWRNAADYHLIEIDGQIYRMNNTIIYHLRNQIDWIIQTVQEHGCRIEALCGPTGCGCGCGC